MGLDRSDWMCGDMTQRYGLNLSGRDFEWFILSECRETSTYYTINDYSSDNHASWINQYQGYKAQPEYMIYAWQHVSSLWFQTMQYNTFPHNSNIINFEDLQCYLLSMYINSWVLLFQYNWLNQVELNLKIGRNALILRN